MVQSADSGVRKLEYHTSPTSGMHNQSEPSVKKPVHFPVEILYEIFWYLSFLQAFPMCQVSKLWYYVIHSNIFLKKYINQLPQDYVNYCKNRMHDSLRILRDWPYQSFYHLEDFCDDSLACHPSSLWKVKWYIHLSGLFKGHIIPPSYSTQNTNAPSQKKGSKNLSPEELARKKKSQFIKCEWNQEQMRRLVNGKRFVNDVVLVEGSVEGISYSGVNNHFATVSLKVDRVKGEEKNIFYHVRYFSSLLGIVVGFFGSVFIICLVGQLATLGLLFLYCLKCIMQTTRFGYLFSIRYIRSKFAADTNRIKEKIRAAQEKFSNATHSTWSTLITHIHGINTIVSVVAEEKWKLLTQRIQDINTSMVDASTALKDFKYRLIIEKEEILNKIKTTIPQEELIHTVEDIVQTLEEAGHDAINDLMH